jgi:DNA-binding transcriptional LysR family regulator
MLVSLDVRMLRSFVSVVETGSVTETARRLGRTQPAISLQLNRLEELAGKTLLRHEGRGMVLTNEGDIVFSYARSILRLHDELLSRLASPEIEGRVILGTPDLYAAFLLPSILELFRTAFPRVQIELRCTLSTPLVNLVHRGEVDLALVTRMKGFAGGDVVGQEQLVWMMGVDSHVHRQNPVPLALLPPGNVYRDYAIEGLNRIGRKWHLACVSDSIAGLQAAVFANMAITVLVRSALVTGMKEIGISDYFPPLPKVDLLLYRAAGRNSPALDALHNYLSHSLKAGSIGPSAGEEADPSALKSMLSGS